MSEKAKNKPVLMMLGGFIVIVGVGIVALGRLLPSIVPDANFGGELTLLQVGGALFILAGVVSLFKVAKS